MDTNNPANQSKLESSMQSTRQHKRKQATIGFGFASDWLRKWREIFKPITKKHRNVNPVKWELLSNYFRTQVKIVLQAATKARTLYGLTGFFNVRSRQTEMSSTHGWRH